MAHPWPSRFPPVISAVEVSALTGHPDFRAAKYHGDLEAATRLAGDLIGRAEAALNDLRLRNDDLRLVAVVEAGASNRIPEAFARAAASRCGIPLDEGIRKAAAAKHTGKSSLYRFSSRAQFAGGVTRGANYVITDDVLTQGGTVSELRQFLLREGCRVVGVTTLAVTPMRERDLDPRQIALTTESRRRLETQFGDAPLRELFKELGVYGGDWRACTEGEAWLISRYPSLATFRAALAVEQLKHTSAGKGVNAGVPVRTLDVSEVLGAPGLPTGSVSRPKAGL